MAHTNNWDETEPTDASNAVDIDNEIRKLRLDARERLAIDHKFAAADAGGAEYGIHKKVTFEDKIASPGLSSNQKCLFPKTGDYECELRYKDKRVIDNLIVFIGEVRLRLGTTVPTGWLGLNGDSIGDDTSGATHTGTNYQDLYYFLWAELADAQFPIAGGRGASAAEDWDAHKKGTMPDARSRMIIGAGQGAGLTNRVIGNTGGAETFNNSHTHTVDSHVHSMQAHTHTLADGATVVSSYGGQKVMKDVTGDLMARGGDPGDLKEAQYTTAGPSVANTGGTGLTTNSSGSAAQNVMNPWIALIMIIKY